MLGYRSSVIARHKSQSFFFKSFSGELFFLGFDVGMRLANHIRLRAIEPMVFLVVILAEDYQLAVEFFP